MMEQFYKRRLPHIQPKGATLFVTFRLAGSLPHAVIAQLQERYEADKAGQPPELRYEAAKRYFSHFDEQLHRSTGPHHLSDPALAQVVAEGLHYRDGRVYRLDAFSIMSNHVHMVFAPLVEKVDLEGTPINYKLSKIMQSLKRHTGRECNVLLGQQGRFWQPENYDHVIRDKKEWIQAMEYVLHNPVKAGLVSEWQDWPFNYSAYF